jgi:general secretion pathway protein K
VTRPPQAPTRGLALIVVLWLLAALSLFAGAFAVTARTEATVARNALGAAHARALADGGIAYGIARLLERAERPGEAWRVDGAAHVVAVGGATIEVSLVQESGKFDINVVSDEVLGNLLTGAGIPPDDADTIVAAFADFRDADDAVRPGGAEAAAYRALGLPYAPKNRPLENIEEFAMVPGVTAAAFKALRPAITVHSGRARIDPATAPREALLAVPGVDAETVDALLAVRADNQFRGVRHELPALKGADAYLAAADAPVFTVRAKAVTPEGAVFVREAVVWVPLDGAGATWVLDWTRGGGS